MNYEILQLFKDFKIYFDIYLEKICDGFETESLKGKILNSLCMIKMIRRNGGYE